MARKNRPPATDLISALEAGGQGFSFFQALRLLRHHAPDVETFAARVHVHPKLSLAFPERDLDSVILREDGHYQVTANFFGLYGVTSPLPTFYTEDLIEERRVDRSAAKDFLDIIHEALYPLLFRAWEKYRLWLAIGEQNDTQRLEQLFSLIGLADPTQREAIPDAFYLLRFSGVMSQFPRSAQGLETLVRGLLEGVPVEIAQCVARRIPVPEQDQLSLGAHGCTLGENSVLGHWVDDMSSQANIVIGPVNAELFRRLMPGQPLHRTLCAWVNLYQSAPVRCALTIKLEPGVGQSTQLGGHAWNCLGLDAWMLPQATSPDIAMHMQVS